MTTRREFLKATAAATATLVAAGFDNEVVEAAIEDADAKWKKDGVLDCIDINCRLYRDTSQGEMVFAARGRMPIGIALRSGRTGDVIPVRVYGPCEVVAHYGKEKSDVVRNSW